MLEPMADSYLMFYSVPLGGKVPLVINNLPKRSEETFEIPIGVGGYLRGTPIRGEYKVSVDQDTYIPDNWTLKLRNNVTGKTTDLQRQDKITAQIDAFRGQQDRVEAPAPGQFSRIEPRVLDIGSGVDRNEKGTEDSGGQVAGYYKKEFAFTLFLTPDNLRDDDVPHRFFLNQNYPNPFNPNTNIVFGLPSESDVRLEVYDILGRRVQTLANGSYDAGVHTVEFDGGRLASGVYLYRLRAGSEVITRKMMLIK